MLQFKTIMHCAFRFSKLIVAAVALTSVSAADAETIPFGNGNLNIQALTDNAFRITYREKSLRDFAIVNLLLRTGLRTIEAVRADVGDITFKANRRILRVWGKGHDTKDDFVVLTDKTYLPIKNYLATRKGAKANEPQDSRKRKKR